MIKSHKDNILLVRPPEFIISGERIPPERQTHGAVLLPLSILQLGSYVRHQIPDIEVHYLDLHLKCKLAREKLRFFAPLSEFIQQQLKSVLEEIRPEIVGITCTLNAFADNFHQTAALVKQIHPEAVVVTGGHYPSSYQKRSVDDNHIDYIVIGEGEILFTNFVREFRKGKLPKRKIINNKKIYLEDFDSFPPLDYDRIEIEKYFEFEMSSIFGNQDRTLNLVTSRGCPCQCIYCATHNVWDYGFRPQSAWNIFHQVADLKKKYDVQTIMFVEDNFVLDKDRVKDFCHLLIENNIKINWYPTSVMVNSLDEEMIHLMALSGCRSLGVAVESGTRRVQGLIKKNVNLDYAKRMIECMKREGMMIHGLFVLGFPGETVEEMNETIHYAGELKCDWCQLSIAMPLYGTEMYERCRENNYLVNEENTVNLYVERVGNITTPEFTPKITEAIVRDANFRLNFIENPNYLAGLYDKALPIFETIARSYPDHFICKYMIWKIYAKNGNQAKADIIYRDLKSLYQRDPDYHDNLIRNYAPDISF